MELTTPVILALLAIGIGGPIILTLWDFITDEAAARYEHFKESRNRQ